MDFQRKLAIAGGQRINYAGAISITRSSSKFATDSTGVLLSFATNTPAVTDSGLLLEGAATNLCTYSNAPGNAVWYRTAVSLATGVQDPAAVQVNESACNAALSRQVITVTSGQVYTVGTSTGRAIATGSG